MSKDKTFMEKYWAEEHAFEYLKDVLWDKLHAALGKEDFSYGSDYYDCSLELYKVPPEDYKLSPGTLDQVYALGFKKVYVNLTNDWQAHFAYYPGLPEWNKRQYNPWMVNYKTWECSDDELKTIKSLNTLNKDN